MKEENCCKCPSKESPLIVSSNSVIKDGHICFCPCHKESKENWEKEFGERFIESRYFERIKQFIHSLLKSQRAELIKDIEGMKKQDEHSKNCSLAMSPCESCAEEFAYNQALEDVLTKLKEITN